MVWYEEVFLFQSSNLNTGIQQSNQDQQSSPVSLPVLSHARASTSFHQSSHSPVEQVTYRRRHQPPPIDWSDEEGDQAGPAPQVINNRNMTDISVPCEVALRYDVDHKKVAAISTATLFAYGIVTPKDTSEAVDRHKVRRQTRKLIKDANEVNWENFSELNNIYFDSKETVII